MPGDVEVQLRGRAIDSRTIASSSTMQRRQRGAAVVQRVERAGAVRARRLACIGWLRRVALTSCGTRRRSPALGAGLVEPLLRASSSPTFFRSALSCGGGATMFMPFFLSRSLYSPFFCCVSAQPRVSASAAALSTRVLGRLVERVEGGLVDDHRVLRQPGLGVVAVLDVLVGLGVVAGRARGHVALDDAGGHRLRELGGLHGHRLRADELGDARRRRAVGAPLHALQVGRRLDRLLDVDALRRPRHGVEQHHALLAELLLERGLLAFQSFIASA